MRTFNSKSLKYLAKITELTYYRTRTEIHKVRLLATLLIFLQWPCKVNIVIVSIFPQKKTRFREHKRLPPELIMAKFWIQM